MCHRLTAVETEISAVTSGRKFAATFFPGSHCRRSSMNSWTIRGFRKAYRSTAAKPLHDRLWTKVCITGQRLKCWARVTYHVVEDCVRRHVARRRKPPFPRMVQRARSGYHCRPLEWQRDWKNKEHYNALMDSQQQRRAYGVGSIRLYDGSSARSVAQKPQLLLRQRIEPQATANHQQPRIILTETST